jgi:hypothetical protein
MRVVLPRVTIEALHREVADLRRTVAHLRAGAGPLPAHLRPVSARAVLATHDATPGSRAVPALSATIELPAAAPATVQLRARRPCRRAW